MVQGNRKKYRNEKSTERLGMLENRFIKFGYTHCTTKVLKVHPNTIKTGTNEKMPISGTHVFIYFLI